MEAKFCKNKDYQSTWQLGYITSQSDPPYINMVDNNFKISWSLDYLRPHSAKQNIIDGSNRIRHKGKL